MAPVIHPEFDSVPGPDISIIKILLILSIYIHCFRMVHILRKHPRHQVVGYEAPLHLLSASCMCLLVLPWSWMLTSILRISELSFGQTLLILALLLLASAVQCIPLLVCHHIYITWKDGVMARYVNGQMRVGPDCSRGTLLRAMEAIKEDGGRTLTVWRDVGESEVGVEKLVRR